MANGTNPADNAPVLVAAKAKLQNKKLQNKNKTNRAIVDSGANTMLMALNTPLEDGGESSKRRCWDFTGQKYIPMAKEGYVWMCFTNPAVSGDNSTEIADGFHMLKVYTQTAAQITDNILSVSRMVKLLGFELKFRPTGWEGFKRKDPNTGRIVKIPVFYDDADMLWYIYFTVGPTRQSAMQIARTQSDVKRQVVDVTGSEWTPSICYAGNAMIRRSRRIQTKEQNIGKITAKLNTGNTGTVPVPQSTGKRPTDSTGTNTGTVPVPQSTGKRRSDSTSTKISTVPVSESTGKRLTDSTGTIYTSTGAVPLKNTSTGKVPANTSTGSVPLNTTRTGIGTEGFSIPTEAPEPIDTRRGTIVGDNNATISSEDSKESGGGLKMLDAADTILYQQNTSLVRPSTRPRDLKLNKEQRHDKLGHFGTHKNCIHCQQVKQRPRQVYKNPTPVYDHIPGRSIHMDSMYLDVQNRHGDWYCAPGWDDCTGYLHGIFIASPH